MRWQGVLPAVTTPFDASWHVDLEFMARHVRWLVEAGCRGVVVLGSLGEAPTLEPTEKAAIVDTAVRALEGKAPVGVGISGLSTAETVQLARQAERLGAQGLMVLPPYVYRGDWRETRAHVSAIIRATSLSCMLYNNPVAYGTDFLPEHIVDLVSDHSNLHAVKESSTDVRRIATLRLELGERVDVLVGIDEALPEGIAAGAVGWVAGLANALPRESVLLFDLTASDRTAQALELYRWFQPLLQMDAEPKFVQLIKLVQQEVGMGNTRVRPPRLELIGEELVRARSVIRDALAKRPPELVDRG